MPHTSSAEKALRQDAKRRDRNRLAKKEVKLAIKKFLLTAKTGTPEQKKADFVACVKKLDKCGVRGIIHRNAAARKVSQLAKMLNAPAPAPARFA